MSKYKLDFYTQYRQFYINDKHSPLKTDSPDFWTVQASDDRLAIEEGVLGIGTECYGPVKGEICILTTEPKSEEFDSCDHVVEGSIEISSGTLQVFPCIANEPALEIEMNPNIYRVRVYSSNLNTVDGDEGDDYYKIEVWPSAYKERTVLKRYHFG
jgi:hypothetical protein